MGFGSGAEMVSEGEIVELMPSGASNKVLAAIFIVMRSVNILGYFLLLLRSFVGKTYSQISENSFSFASNSYNGNLLYRLHNIEKHYNILRL